MAFKRSAVRSRISPPKRGGMKLGFHAASFYYKDGAGRTARREKETAMNKYVDLHLHLDGSLPKEVLGDLAKLSGVTLPTEDPAELEQYITVIHDGPDLTLTKCLEKFALPISLLQTEESLELSVYALLRKLSGMNVLYAEIRYAPGVHCQKGLTQTQVMEAVLRGLHRGTAEFPIRAQIIACCMRGADYEVNLETLRVAKAYLGQGVCCADLAGDEINFPTADYADLFAWARQEGLPFTIHAGEAAGPESVRAALAMGAQRIGHGVGSIKDPELVAYLAEKQIPLEVCVTSNVQCCCVPSLEEHPVAKLLRAGVKVTLNTDNMTISGTTQAGELELVRKTFGLTDEECRQLRRNAVDAAFLPQTEKDALWAN